jgi:phosphate uptake regulator
MVGSFKSRSAMKLLKALSDTAQSCVRQALDDFVERRSGTISVLPRKLEEAGYLQDELSRDLLDSMSQLPSTVSSSTCLLLACQRLGRITEHAANIAKVCRLTTNRKHPVSAGTRCSQ